MFLPSQPRYLFARALLGVLVFGACAEVRAQVAAAESIVVQAEEVGSAYGAPASFSRARFAPLTTAYVLPPWAFSASTIYQGSAFRHGLPDHLFTQEVELGLPHRFGVAAETSFERFNGGGNISAISLEARYALADWNKIPLNPTLFAEYKFGVGQIRHEEGPPPPPGEEAEGGAKRPDAYEFRLLLAQDFGERVEWAFNTFFEKENTGDRGREWGFAQSIATPLLRNERLKAGVEMKYTNFTVKDTRGDPLHRFVIGPTIAWKPSRTTRLDVSPLFGVTDDAARAEIFVVFSMLFGPGPESGEAEGPASMRNR